MSLDKVTYVDGETVITADNLNDIQNAIGDNEDAIQELQDGELSFQDDGYGNITISTAGGGT